MPIKGLFTPYELDRIHTAIAYIDQHYQDSISADSLAIEAGIDIKHLQAGIQFLKGLTVHNYLLKVRVLRATEDLENFGRSIKFIAIRNGFSSASHFGSEFKKRMGLTPREYRYQLLLSGSSLGALDRFGEPAEKVHSYCTPLPYPDRFRLDSDILRR